MRAHPRRRRLVHSQSGPAPRRRCAEHHPRRPTRRGGSSRLWREVQPRPDHTNRPFAAAAETSEAAPPLPRRGDRLAMGPGQSHCSASAPKGRRAVATGGAKPPAAASATRGMLNKRHRPGRGGGAAEIRGSCLVALACLRYLRPVRGGVRVVPTSTGSAAAALPPCSTRGYSPSPRRGFKRDHAIALPLTSSPVTSSPLADCLPPPPPPPPSPYARSECGRAAGFVEFPCRILPHPPLLQYRTLPLISPRIRGRVSRALSRLTLSLIFSLSSSSRSSRCLRVASR